MNNRDKYINKFGYSEMYEWAQMPPSEHSLLGKFVQFDKRQPDKIYLASSDKNILGITTINSLITSDDPDEWCQKNYCNEYGDTFLTKERLAVGGKEYDHNEEIAYIRTRAWEQLIPITNDNYNPKQNYNKRSSRPEWIMVNLLGKVIVEDDGKCEPGKWCKPYTGKTPAKMGTAIPASETDQTKFYVLKRISDKTILILNK